MQSFVCKHGSYDYHLALSPRLSTCAAQQHAQHTQLAIRCILCSTPQQILVGSRAWRKSPRPGQPSARYRSAAGCRTRSGWPGGMASGPHRTPAPGPGRPAAPCSPVRQAMRERPPRAGLLCDRQPRERTAPPSAWSRLHGAPHSCSSRTGTCPGASVPQWSARAGACWEQRSTTEQFDTLCTGARRLDRL